MHRRTVGLVVGALLAGGCAGAVAMVPASAATSGNAVTSRLAAIKSALSGLVSDGTLTQAQADKVASTLEKALPSPGPGGAGMRRPGPMGATLDAAAKALGTTTDTLRTELRSGKTLAAVAKEKGVAVDTLVKAMVAGEEKDLATAVTNGRITQAQADALKAGLTARVTRQVDGTGPAWGGGHRGKGLGGEGGPGRPGLGGAGRGGPSPTGGTANSSTPA